MRAKRGDFRPGQAAKSGWATYGKRYSLAFVLALGALGLHHLFAPSLHNSMLFAFSSIAIALSAGLGGLGPGLFATVLSAIFVFHGFFEASEAFTMTLSQVMGKMLAFLVIGGLLSFISDALHRSRRQVEEKEELFRVIFERASIGKVLVDPATGRFVLVNRKFSAITGYRETELVGMTFRHLMYPEDRAESEACFGRLVRGEIAEYTAERRYVRSDGRLIWVEVLVTMLRTADGRPVHAISSIQDITKRKQMEEALRENEARFRQVIRSAGSVIIGVDLAGRITMYNGQAQQLFGYTEQEVLGQHVVGTIVPPRDTEGQEMRPLIADVLHHSEKYQYNENENLTRDGRRLWMAWTNRPILEPDGRLRELICVGLDLTERKRMEDALRLSEERFRATFEHAPVGIEQVGLDGRLQEVNDALCRMLGYTREELLGKTFAEITHPEDREAEDKLLQQLLVGEIASYQIEKRYLCKRGEPLWVRVTSSLTHQPHSYRISIIEDISVRKEAEALQHERSFLRQVIDAAPSMIFVKDWEGRFILANQALAHCYGTSVEGVLGKTDTDFNPNAEELEHFWRDDHQVMNERREILIPEEQVTCATGEVHWFSTIKVPLVNQDGTCDKLLGVASDITAHKRAEEALRQSEERLSLAVEFAQMGLWDTDLLAGKVFWSPQLFKIVGYEPTPGGCVPLERAWQFSHPDDLAAQLEEFRQAREEHRVYRLEGRCIRADNGETRWILARGHFIYDETGRAVRTVGLLFDITERKRTEEALRVANEQLRQADRCKDEFLAMLAHELRNPLAPIRNAAQIIRMAGCHEQVLQRQRDIIDRQVSHMARLLEDLLDVSRITRGTVVIQKQRVDLAEALGHAIEMTTPLIEARRQLLRVDLPAEELWVEGDPDRLAQVVGNLLTNAAKYTDEGGEIWLEGRKELDQAMIRVRDSGMGIAPEVLPHIFELFAQADQSLARSRGGLGIGLTMVQKLVQMHGGTVEAHSEGLGKGSEFIVRLPVLTASREGGTSFDFPDAIANRP